MFGNKNIRWWIAVGLAARFAATAQTALALDGDLICPATATAGAAVSIDLVIENQECSAFNARVLSTIVGNSGDNLAGIGVFGPAVAAPSITVAEPVSVVWGCVAGTCAFTSTPCTQNSQCPFCRASVPSMTTMTIDAQPVLPTSLIGTVAALIIALETEDEEGERDVADIAECLIEVE